MNTHLSDLVARELRLASADTADCPALIHRVAAGVRRRRLRRRGLAAALGTAAALIVALPAVGLGGTGTGQHLEASARHGLCAPDSNDCGLSPSGAALALRRANPPDGPILDPVAANLGCLHRPFCRGPL